MGLLPVDRFKRSTRKNFIFTTKLTSLRKHQIYNLPFNSFKIKALILNIIFSWQIPVVSKACGLVSQVLLINYIYHNRG